MTVPLDRLYHYIENIAQKVFGGSIIIYRFWPNGSKNITNLTKVKEKTFFECYVYPSIFCNDQEPLDHSLYMHHTTPNGNDNVYLRAAISTGIFRDFKNLESSAPRGIFEKGILVHSEKRSEELKKYIDDDQLIPVYYWCHALIALDWYRYARHENFDNDNVEPNKIFLMYNRAWSGTREYRLKFADLLIQNKLINFCQTNFNPIDPDLQCHYLDYNCKNTAWEPKHILDNFFQPTDAVSSCSADFVTSDYASTDIEVVLETLFDDTRLHLTEKTLRPIACGQPFLLVSTHDSLQYLKDYGFKTFDTVWDESYDTIVDPAQRLVAVTNLMKNISQWDTATKTAKMTLAKDIALYNKKWFFSKEFFDCIVDELTQNFRKAFYDLDHNTNGNYIKFIRAWERILPFEDIKTELYNNKNPLHPRWEDIELILQICRDRIIHGRFCQDNSSIID